MVELIRSRDGTPIAFTRQGRGPALVCVAGALTDRAGVAPLARELEDSFTVIAFDRRGRGESGDAVPYAVEREIEDLAVLLGQSDGPAYLYGHSSGGTLALHAAFAGLPISRLVLYEPPFILQGDRPRPAADLPARLEALVAAGDREAAVRAFLVEAPRLSDEVIGRLASGQRWPAMLALAHTLPYDARVTGACALPLARIAALGTPALVLHGGASSAWMRAGTRALADALPEGRLVALEDQGHGGAREAPALVAREVRRFLVG